MADYFPAFLDLRGRRCLVVGGGPVGERKSRDLLAAGACVILVSPTVTPGLAALVAAGALMHRPRAFRRGDARGCALVIAATGRQDVDDVVAVAARQHRALVNVVDRPLRCDFIVPSVLRRGNLQVAVSTGGRSPALAREIRRALEPLFDNAGAEVVEWLGEARRCARGLVAASDRPVAAERLVPGALERVLRAPGVVSQHVRNRARASPDVALRSATGIMGEDGHRRTAG